MPSGQPQKPPTAFIIQPQLYFRIPDWESWLKQPQIETNFKICVHYSILRFSFNAAKFPKLHFLCSKSRQMYWKIRSLFDFLQGVKYLHTITHRCDGIEKKKFSKAGGHLLLWMKQKNFQKGLWLVAAAWLSKKNSALDCFTVETHLEASEATREERRKKMAWWQLCC